MHEKRERAHSVWFLGSRTLKVNFLPAKLTSTSDTFTLVYGISTHTSALILTHAGSFRMTGTRFSTRSRMLIRDL